jgi:hypothetical protein
MRDHMDCMSQIPSTGIRCLLQFWTLECRPGLWNLWTAYGKLDSVVNIKLQFKPFLLFFSCSSPSLTSPSYKFSSSSSLPSSKVLSFLLPGYKLIISKLRFSLCDGPIPRPEEPYRLCVCLCVWSDTTITLQWIWRSFKTKKERKKERKKEILTNHEITCSL